MKKKAFTLIELIAVLVILAILALIVTPLVMNIIRKAKISADKRSIDAYGRSVELAIANYLLDEGKFPTNISELTIEYSGDRVECSTTQLNSDSTVYLAGCNVNGRSVENYTYGSDKTPLATTYTAYTVGDQVTYNNVDYYVIKDSDESESVVTLLKAEPLSVAEVNQYGANHINRYTDDGGMSGNRNGYGTIAYYNTQSCKYHGGVDFSGCTIDYNQSDIKYVVDAWAADKVLNSDLIEDEKGYKVRLITYDELLSNLGYSNSNYDSGHWVLDANYTPSWVYGNADYYTMSSYESSNSAVWTIYKSGELGGSSVVLLDGSGSGRAVRPVITLKKSALN